MNVIETPLAGLVVIEPTVHADNRGTFQEIWQAERYGTLGISTSFSQDNISESRKGVLRGLHYQAVSPQGKLVLTLTGEIFDVAVDIRPKSLTFGKWFGIRLSARNHLQLWVPPGFAHGFCVLSEQAAVYYKCTTKYLAHAQRSIRWDDPDIGIEWPIDDPILSSADGNAPIFSSLGSSATSAVA